MTDIFLRTLAALTISGGVIAAAAALARLASRGSLTGRFMRVVWIIAALRFVLPVFIPVEIPVARTAAEKNEDAGRVLTADGALTPDWRLNFDGALMPDWRLNFDGALTPDWRLNFDGALTSDWRLNSDGTLTPDGRLNSAGTAAGIAVGGGSIGVSEVVFAVWAVGFFAVSGVFIASGVRAVSRINGKTAPDDIRVKCLESRQAPA